MRQKQGAEQVAGLLPYLAFCQVRNQDAAGVFRRRDVGDENTSIVHRVAKVEFWSGLTQDIAQYRGRCDLPHLVEDGCRRFCTKMLIVTLVFLLPEPEDHGVCYPRYYALAEFG